MKEGKPFFYRVDAADFFTITNSFKSDKELGKFIRQFSFDLITKDGNSDYARRIISEATEYINKKKEAGKKGGEQRASSAKAALKQCYDSANSKSVASSSTETKDIKPLPTFVGDSGKEYSYEELFETVWSRYPRKDGKKEALRHYWASVKTTEDMEDLCDALIAYQKYLKDNDISTVYTKQGSTWFNNWRDWVPTKEDEA